jgi:hypothetical protein
MHDSFISPHIPTCLEVRGDAGSIHAYGVMTPEPGGTVMESARAGLRTRPAPSGSRHRRQPSSPVTGEHGKPWACATGAL